MKIKVSGRCFFKKWKIDLAFIVMYNCVNNEFMRWDRDQMKKYFSILLAICLCFTCMAGCSFGGDKMISDENREYRVLFVGNSFTEFNNLATDIFKPMCEQAGYNVTVDTVLRGAYVLEAFANSADPYGAKVDEFLNANKYDVVILQEQSHRPISDYNSFLKGAKGLAEKPKESTIAMWIEYK